MRPMCAGFVPKGNTLGFGHAPAHLLFCGKAFINKPLSRIVITDAASVAW